LLLLAAAPSGIMAGSPRVTTAMHEGDDDTMAQVLQEELGSLGPAMPISIGKPRWTWLQ
jgi:hypothetical protein